LKAANQNERRRMGRSAEWMLILVLGVLAFSFFRAQVVSGPAWALQSESNRLRVLSVPAPRGAIFDRSGRIVAENVWRALRPLLERRLQERPLSPGP
jgi:cell division protein FtsI/penicillin-binding protein 2